MNFVIWSFRLLRSIVYLFQITKPFFAAIEDEKVQQKLLHMLFDLLVNCKNSLCVQTISSVFKGVSCTFLLINICSLLNNNMFQCLPFYSLLSFGVIPSYSGNQVVPRIQPRSLTCKACIQPIELSFWPLLCIYMFFFWGVGRQGSKDHI